MMKNVWRLALVLALVAVACRAEINIALDLEEDGSGVFAVEMGFDEEFQQLLELGAEGQDISESIFEGFNLDVPGAETEEVVRGDMTFFVAKAPFSNIPELNSDLLADGGQDNPFDRLQVSVDDDGAVIDAALTIPDATEGAGDLGELPFDPATFTEDIFAFNFIVNMPGTVERHNATEVMNDGRLRWAIPITGGDVEIMAESSFGGGGLPGWLIGVLVLVALGIVGAILMSRRNRQTAVAAVESAGMTAPATGDVFGGAAAPADVTTTAAEASPGELAEPNGGTEAAAAEPAPDVPDLIEFDDPPAEKPDEA